MKTRRSSHAPAYSGFTLVELLVVIAIIALLIAILLPILNRARRPAQVLASPVAYQGIDNRVHLTDPSGRSDLTITPAATIACPVCHTAPAWSPSGRRLGVRVSGSQRNSVTAIIDPSSGETKKHSSANASFIGWLDSTQYVEAWHDTLTIVNADTGGQRQVPNKANILFLSPAPTSSPGPVIAAVSGPAGDTITFLRHDLSLGRPVWVEPGSSRDMISSQEAPRVDPMGEYVGWTLNRGRPYVAIKAVRDPSAAPPTLLGTQWPAAYFCDWTEQGAILANIRANSTRWKLVVMSRTGVLIHELLTEIPPAEGPIASWRKYEHR